MGNFKDFGSFKLCGEGKYPKTFLLKGQAAKGEEINETLPHPLLRQKRPAKDGALG
jgi:hypothetical protein